MLLEGEGYKVRFLQQRNRITTFLQDIKDCRVIVCGDTLTMHLALALRKKVVAIFTCTSPTEIYDYGRMIKVVSPLLEEYFYKREYSSEPINAISLPTVYGAVKHCLGVDRLKS